MNGDEPRNSLLLRYLDGRVTPEERQRVAELLRSDAAAREFLRTVSEQAVMVADLERVLASRTEVLRGPAAAAAPQGPLVVARFHGWPRRVAAAAAAVLILAALALLSRSEHGAGLIHVSRVIGSSQWFDSKGNLESELVSGMSLDAGDTLETPSCDAWIELKLRDGSALTIAGNSILRILDREGGAQRFKLSGGSLWVSPVVGTTARPLLIQTPTMTVEARGTQFDIQASPAETMLRVNHGSARVRHLWDGSLIDVSEGHQVTASWRRKEPLAAMVQSAPINYWACDLWKVPEVILGRWLPPTEKERARLRADPLVWPRKGRDPMMLYAVAFAAWKSTDHPVVLRADSKLRFRGRTERASMVRFGFSAQKMRGAFAGKFETDFQPDALGPAGETWEVEIPLTHFRPLHPRLAVSPDGLELTDVYALTVHDDAGLEVNHIELIPQDELRRP